MTVVMTQTGRTNIPEILTESYFKDVDSLRNKLLMYRFKNWHKIQPEKAMEVDISFVEPRLRQVNRGLMALFVHDDVLLDKFKKYLVDYQDKIVVERSESFDGEIINAIARLLVSDYNFITSQDIVDEMKNHHVDSAYEINSRGIGRKLKSLGLSIVIHKVGGDSKRCLVLNNGILDVLFGRYISDGTILEKLRQSNFIKGVNGYVSTTVTFTTLTEEKNIQKNLIYNSQQGTVKSEEISDTPPLSVGKRNLRNFVTEQQNNNQKVPSEMKVVDIHHKCVNCQETPCVAWNNKDQPVCKLCAEQIKRNGEWLRYE
jgi:hypothetical protein